MDQKESPSGSTGIKACMSCASMLITPCNLKRHAMTTYICEDCGWIGGAATYKSESDRQKYIAQKKNGRQ
ncbi:MAG: hypothetical protein WAX07_09465 [Candidatus Altiarchaeia archaeon]